MEELVVYSSHLPLEHTAEDKVRKLAIPVAAKLRALRLVYLGSDVGLRSDAFGGGDGSVSIVFYSEETCLEAVVEADGSASFLVKRGLGYQVEIEEESESASDQEIDSWLHHIAGRPTWKLVRIIRLDLWDHRQRRFSDLAFKRSSGAHPDSPDGVRWYLST